MISIKTTIDIKKIERALSPGTMRKAKYIMMNGVLADMSKYVPVQDSTLVGTGNLSGDNITWDTPYAKAQFYGSNGRAVFSNYSKPGTGKRWDLKAEHHAKDWEDTFLKGIGL